MQTKYIDEINTIEKLIDRSKDTNIIYLTKDTILNTKAVQILANYIERLQKENESKQKAYDDCYCEYKHYKQFDSIPKQVIRDKLKDIELAIAFCENENRFKELIIKKGCLKELLG